MQSDTEGGDIQREREAMVTSCGCSALLTVAAGLSQARAGSPLRHTHQKRTSQRDQRRAREPTRGETVIGRHADARLRQRRHRRGIGSTGVTTVVAGLVAAVIITVIRW